MNERYTAPVPLTDEVIELARILWDYHHMHHQLVKSDCILALGSHDLRVANRAAELWLDGWAPYIIFSGGLGNLTLGMWQESEADQFAAIALSMGVPKEKILVENRSTNTGENILFTKQLLNGKGLEPQKLLLVQKPYMERRTYATVKKLWAEKEIIVTSPQFTFENYAADDIPIEKVIHIMTGDLQRIREYPAKGFQIFQEIPAEVWKAYEQLVALGFTGHLI
jgi:uncharacterized SAM-binding protein YcdF (DUF218 family)